MQITGLRAPPPPPKAQNLAKCSVSGPAALSEGPKPFKIQVLGPRRPLRRPKNLAKYRVLGPTAPSEGPRPRKIQRFGAPPPLTRMQKPCTIHGVAPSPGLLLRLKHIEKCRFGAPTKAQHIAKCKGCPPRSEGAKALQNTWLPRGPVRSPIAIAQSWSQLRGTTAIATVDDAYTGGRREWRSR